MRWKLILAGDVGAGKSTLCKALLSLPQESIKTQSPAFYGDSIIDVPGEFLMHPHLRRNFLAIAQDAEAIVYVHSLGGGHLGIPPGFLEVRPHQPVIGVINKIDLAESAENSLNKAEAILQGYGIQEPYHKISALDRAQVELFRAWLVERNFL